MSASYDQITGLPTFYRCGVSVVITPQNDTQPLPEVHPISAETQLIISPISSRECPASIDYKEQVFRKGRNEQVMWDDTKHNKSQAGDRFGFWFYKEKVVIHTITKVCPPSDRLPSWSANVGQGDRNVVFLSESTITIPWDKWFAMDGAKRCMGTATVKKGLGSILHYCIQMS
jgi:hypothetical protein